jgi:hypothetical protein
MPKNTALISVFPSVRGALAPANNEHGSYSAGAIEREPPAPVGSFGRCRMA